MNINEPGIYHIYNRGNNQQTIFFSQENYFYFLRKCHKYIKPDNDILAWCLMTNHFHFLIKATKESIKPVKSGGIFMPVITNGFRLLQSSYAKGINRQLNRSGNLFQQKTKSKFLSDKDGGALTAFHYIHQNPVAAGIVTSSESWPYSSFPDYAGLRNGKLCNKEKAFELLGLSAINFRVGSTKIDEERIRTIF